MVTGSLATMSAFHLWSQEVKVADFLFYLFIFFILLIFIFYFIFFLGGVVCFSSVFYVFPSIILGHLCQIRPNHRGPIV